MPTAAPPAKDSRRCRLPSYVGLSQYRGCVKADDDPAKLASDQTPDVTPVVRGLDLQALISFPATAAFLLGLIYAVGSITRSAELNHAGVPIAVAFPLIPIEQDLARGVQVVVRPSLLIGVILIVAGAALFIIANDVKKHGAALSQDQAGQVDAVDPGPRKLGTLERILSLVVGSALIVFVAVSTPLVFASAAIGALVSVLVFRAGPSSWRVPGRIALGFLVMLVFLAFAVSSLFIELVAPPSLPTVTLQRTRGGPLRGSLITLANGIWYVVAPHGQVLAIDSSDVQMATIMPGRKSKLANESLPRLLGI